MASKKEDIFIKSLENKRIPVLTLDNKWHRLFTMMEPDRELKRLEGELNTLLKLQGKMNTDSKSIRKIKKKLMDEIVQLMEHNDVASDKKVEENKRLIEECNQKLEDYQDKLLEIPRQIDEANYKLMIRTMEMCYEVLQTNTKEIDEIGEWITKIRVELKKNIVRKQEKEIKNHELYAYMHDIFGADVVEIFDMKQEHVDKIIQQREQMREKKKL
ncbi:MAG: hypothetical protein IKW30_06360 [Lachnospiraceae bacterium]|nr:hypothetical protein [Lachnospiraceae bacterium]